MRVLEPRNSVQDKIDSTYIEYCIFSLFKIDIINLIKTKASLAKNFHIQPSEIDRMPMWEYEIFMKTLNSVVDEENKKQQSEIDKYDINSYKKMANPSNMNKMMNPQMPKMNFIERKRRHNRIKK